MPSKSRKQQRLFQMALAVRKGEMKRKDAWKSVLSIVDGDMTNKQIEDFCVLENTCVMTYDDWCSHSNQYIDNVEKYELEIQFLENENNKTKDKDKIKKNEERIKQLKGMIQDNLALAFPNRDRAYGMAAEGFGHRFGAGSRRVDENYYDETTKALKKSAMERAVDFEYSRYTRDIENFKSSHGYIVEDAEKLVDIIAGMEFSDRVLGYFFNEIDKDFYGMAKNRTSEGEDLIRSYGIGPFNLLSNDGYYEYFDDYIIIIDDIVYSFRKDDSPFKNRKLAEIFVYKVWGLAPDCDMEMFVSRLGFSDRKSYGENRTYLLKYYPENLVDTLISMYDSWCEENGYEKPEE